MLTVLLNTFEIDLPTVEPVPDVRSFACVPDEQALRER